MKIQKTELKIEVNPRNTTISFHFFLATVTPLFQLFDADVAEFDTRTVPQKADVPCFPF
jgi:hypothetical protein